jgi:metal-responsive CopG/Arc/MetJ family transcriptional regulator
MLTPITIRIPRPLMAEIEKIVEQNAMAGLDKSTVIRELLAEAVMRRAAEASKKR